MELPSRREGDILLPAGEMTDIRRRLRAVSARHDLSSVIVSAFDHRTRVLPFIFADTRIAPAGVRAIGSAMLDAGFEKTRIVLQQWNPGFRPQQMRLDGRVPDLFMVSSMHLHSARCDELIRDVCRMDAAVRPLIIAGGPRVIYSPWEVFGTDPAQPWGADVAVTGEEYVLLSLLEVLLAWRGVGESLRSAFIRARAAGALNDVPGLVYARTDATSGLAEELIDTGVQRLVADLDELPFATLGYSILEPPGSHPTLSAYPLATDQVRKHNRISTVVLTIGCKFRCAYCPIPAYNQRQHRVKSGERIAAEVGQIADTYGIINFFGTDDNFFNRTERTMEIVESLARRVDAGQRPYCKIRYATEATVHDTIRMREHLPQIRRSGLRALWLGVEDITGTLVKKGQGEDQTLEAFRLLRHSGIFPIPMMMYHDGQPLVSWRGNYGLLNQLNVLRKAGAVSAQILMLTPSPGSKWFADTYTSGCAFDSVEGRSIEPHIVDGNYVVASRHPRPWLKQLQLLVAYAFFFNPVRLLFALIHSKSNIRHGDAETRPAQETEQYSLRKRWQRRIYLKGRSHLLDAAFQLVGILGLVPTCRRTLAWSWRLFRGQVQRTEQPPLSHIPMRAAKGGPACHALPGTVESPIHPHPMPVAGPGTSAPREAA